MANEFTTDVLVVGAGAAGLTLGIELARRDVRFRLIDKIETPFGGSRGKGIQPRTQEVFESLGVIDRLWAAGGPYPLQRVYSTDGTFADSPVMDDQDPSPAEPYLTSLMLPQALTEGVLRGRLLELGHRPEYGTELTSFDQDADGVTARLRVADAETVVRAKYLIAADGGRSHVRTTLDVGFPGQTLGVRAIVADLDLTGLSRDVWHRFASGISFCPLMGTDMFQLQGPIPLEGDIDLSVDGLNALVKERSGRSDIIVSKVNWASAYTMNARLADNYRIGRILLAGDAAHIHPPTGGQGLNTSVQDAFNLGWKLAAVVGGAPDSLLDTYEEERRPVAAGMLGLATKLLDAAGRGDLRRGREVRQLDLGYEGSSLALEDAGRTDGLLAGDRAPDAPVRGAGGQKIRLFSLLHGTHWTLLTPSEAPAALAARMGLRIHRVGLTGEVVDAEGHFARAYGLAGDESVLVRPDGYVAAIFSASDTAAVEALLARVGLKG